MAGQNGTPKRQPAPQRFEERLAARQTDESRHSRCKVTSVGQIMVPPKGAPSLNPAFSCQIWPVLASFFSELLSRVA